MARIGISEFTFGFAFLYEHATAAWGDLAAAPILPSLNEEEGLGYDARLPTRGADYYYQFKVSEHLHRANARYRRDGTYVGPYHQIALHRDGGNRQHRALRKLSEVASETYYVAPCFRTQQEFDEAFLLRRVTPGSMLIAVCACDDICDSEQHYLTFCDGTPGFKQHSEAMPHVQAISGAHVERLYRSSARHWRDVDMRFADRVRQNAETVIGAVWERHSASALQGVLDALGKGSNRGDAREVILQAARALLVLAGVVLVIVGERA